MQSEYFICEEHKKGCQSKAAIIVECLRLEIWYSEIVTMTSTPHLTEELRWQAIGRLEAGQSQIKVARWQKSIQSARSQERCQMQSQDETQDKGQSLLNRLQMKVDFGKVDLF
ncbi:hypothetical protein TNCV_2641011 [Trichonephila clavipes]|nr:hypothetical protein TNCV_2641011 [Trichonephila clavipes]